MEMEDLAKSAGELLKKTGLTLSLAESCTGGLIAHRITNISGSSNYFLGGVVAYSNEAKEKILGVPHETLLRYGAVSENTALAMAEGVRTFSGIEVGLSATGIAGPTGGTPDKPVGTVWLAARVGDRERVVCRRFLGDRDQIRRRAAQSALDLVRLLLDSSIG
jgi:nicotinamide-nucleotide amidase